MPVEITYTQARDNLAKLLDTVTEDREVVIIRRRGGEDAALVAADELSSLMATAHLLRSPANAQRLLDALSRALKNEGQHLSIDDLRREVDLDEQTP
jgi:antitoxin YefM